MSNFMCIKITYLKITFALVIKNYFLLSKLYVRDLYIKVDNFSSLGEQQQQFIQGI